MLVLLQRMQRLQRLQRLQRRLVTLQQLLEALETMPLLEQEYLQQQPCPCFSPLAQEVAYLVHHHLLPICWRLYDDLPT